MPHTAVADPETGLTLEQLAARHGLDSAGKLPSLPAYIRQLWSYRHFISSYANAKASSSLGNTHLGMIWQVLTPLLNAGVYYLIFGVVIIMQYRVILARRPARAGAQTTVSV